jgi:ABC-type xylose transport system permease subunit
MNKTKTMDFINKYTMIIVLVLLVIFFSIGTGGSILMPMNISSLISQNAYVFILATGMLLCILTGGNIDLSVGSVVCFVGAIGAVLMVNFKMNFFLAVIIMFIVSIVLGIPSALGYGVLGNIAPLGMDFLTFFDYVSNSVMMPIVAIGTCLLVGWFVGTKEIENEITVNGEPFKRRGIFRVMVKYVAPVFLVVILVFYSLAQFGVIDF